MKIKHVIITVITLTNFFVHGQIKKPINFGDCLPKDVMFTNSETSPSWKSDEISLNDYFESVLKSSPEMKGLTGKLILGILINENGETCLNSFLDYDEAGFEWEIFKQAIAKMPIWNPAVQTGKPVTFNKTIVLKIKKGKIQ